MKMNRLFFFSAVLLMILPSCIDRRGQSPEPFPENVAEIQSRIYGYVSDSEGMPHVEIVYNVPDSVTWRFIARTDSFYYVREVPDVICDDTVFTLDVYGSDIHCMRQLISALNPHTVPYRYGTRNGKEVSLIILIDNDTILVDNDFHNSVVPSEMIQIYKEMFKLERQDLQFIRSLKDLPSYNYGSIRLSD